MALDRLDALETRIRDLVKLVHDLKRKNASLEEEVKAARQRLASQDDLNRRWEKERIDIKVRIEKVDWEKSNCLNVWVNPKEVALD